MHKTLYFFPILVKTTLFFPVLKAPAPFPKRGVRALNDAAGKAIHMSRFCYEGETKIIVSSAAILLGADPSFMALTLIVSEKMT